MHTKHPSIKAFDAIVVGSGATGSWAAKELCESGLTTLVIEAGGPYDPSREVSYPRSHQASYNVQSRCFAFSDLTRQCFVDDGTNPYTTPPGAPFAWIRSQIVGGRTLLWSGHCYRLTDQEFKASTRDGRGMDWPLDYNLLKQYYDEVEHDIGVQDTLVSGSSEAKSPFFEPPSMDEMNIYSGLGRFGVAWKPARIALTEHNEARKPCIHCGSIDKGCLQYTSTPAKILGLARRTGRMTLWTSSAVRHISTDTAGRAVGVHVVNRQTGRHTVVRSRIIFLCASALESTRIMLNSACGRHARGFANSSGVLGHYLMDHVRVTFAGIIKGEKCFAQRSLPRFIYLPNQHPVNDTVSSRPGGYSYVMSLASARYWLGAKHAGCGVVPICGHELTPELDSTVVRLTGSGEMLPDYRNRVGIDPNGAVDAWGIPVLNINCQHYDHEKLLSAAMIRDGKAILEGLGATLLHSSVTAIEPGLALHEAGTCRMGRSSDDSVLNAYNQCHDASNVFVTDGSAFPRIGTQHPTLTMMALTVRACRHAVALLRNGEI